MWGILFVLVMASSFIINLCLGWSWFWGLTLVLGAICLTTSVLYVKGLGVSMAVIAALLAGAGLAVVRRQGIDYFVVE
jgi:hypothetical protein